MNKLEQSITIIIHAVFLYVGFTSAIKLKNNKNREMSEFSLFFSKSLQPEDTWNYFCHKQIPSERTHVGDDFLWVLEVSSIKLPLTVAHQDFHFLQVGHEIC